MSLKFRSAPIGPTVSLFRDNAQLKRAKPEQGVAASDCCKMAFSQDPVKKFAGRGHWFEMRVEDFSGGSLSLMGIGYTSTDPAALLPPAPEEGEEPAPPPVLPGRPDGHPKSYVAGYARSCWWDGSCENVEEIFKVVKPFKIFSIGAMVTLSGCLEIYIDRKLVLAFDPALRGLEPINTDEPLWAFVDCSGALRKGTLMSDSVPPSPDEEMNKEAAPAPYEDAE